MIAALGSRGNVIYYRNVRELPKIAEKHDYAEPKGSPFPKQKFFDFIPSFLKPI